MARTDIDTRSDTRGRDRVSGREIRDMFAGIVGRYDLLNHLLSLNLDRLWRRRAVRASGVGPSERVLDVCSGTGDLAIAFARSGCAGRVIATDFCLEMLRRLPAKAARKGRGEPVAAGVADAMRLPFRDGVFDVASVAFGIRNLEDPARGIAEMARVLRTGGRLVILEFSWPRRFPARALFRLYRGWIPRIARIVGGSEPAAYEYLNRSVEEFARRFDLAAIVAGHGMNEVRVSRWSGGIVELVVGVKGGP